MDQKQIQELHEHIDACIEKYGFFMMGITGVSLYSVGFFQQDKPEILFSIGDSSLANLFNRLCTDHLNGELVFDQPFNCKWAKIGGKPMRCIVVTQSEEDSEWIRENVALSVRKRAPDYTKFAIIQIADAQNLLPNEPGYDLGDQTINMLKHNVAGASSNGTEPHVD